MWWLSTVLAQVQDPLQKAVESNPTVAAIVASLGLLFGADKVAFWVSKAKTLRSNGHHKVADYAPEIKKSLEALVDVQKDLAATMRDVTKTTERLDEYCQRHFETTGLELRSVREELRAIRERIGVSRGGAQ